jgi:hypothetical protein
MQKIKIQNTGEIKARLLQALDASETEANALVDELRNESARCWRW